MAKYKYLYVLLISFLCLGLIPTLCFAQAPKRELLMFQDIPIVTSASKRAEPITKAPAAIYVITAEEIKNMDYTNLWDLFRKIPGAQVFTIDGRQGSVGPGGFAEKHTRRNQLLIDGRSAYSPVFGGTDWDQIPIFPENIERIEVIRGPNATLYGSNAFTGVINIVTKKAKDTKGLTLKQGLGTHGYQRSMVRFGDNTENMDYRVTYGYHYDRGYGSRDGKDINDDQRDHALTWRSEYAVDDNSNIEVYVGDKEEKARPVSVVESSTTNESHQRRNFQMIRYNTKIFDDQDFYIQLFRNEVYANRHGGLVHKDTSEAEERQYDLEIQHTFDWLDDKASTVWGFNFRYNEGQSYLFNADSAGASYNYGGSALTDHLYRLFFNNNHQLNDYWTFVYGLMFEDNHFTGSSYSPRATLLYAPKENHIFRTTYARAYRTPTMLEDTHNHLYVNNGVISFRTLGNAELKNELVDAYEVGYNSVLMDNKLHVDIQGYLNEYKNLVQVFQTTGTGPAVVSNTVYTFNNNQYATARGIELSATLKPKNWVDLYVNGSFQKVKSTLDTWNDMHPKFKANFGSRFTCKKLGMTANFDLYYVDTYEARDLENPIAQGTEIAPYLRFDARLAKTFFDGNLEWAVRGENLLDQSHSESVTGTSSVVEVPIERAVYTTITAKF